MTKTASAAKQKEETGPYAERIDAIAAHVNLSLRQLAKALSIPYPTIRSYRYKVTPRVDFLTKVKILIKGFNDNWWHFNTGSITINPEQIKFSAVIETEQHYKSIIRNLENKDNLQQGEINGLKQKLIDSLDRERQNKNKCIIEIRMAGSGVPIASILETVG